MANYETVHDALLPYKTIEPANHHLIQKKPSQDQDALIATLPLQPKFPSLLRLYQGFWVPEFALQGALALRPHFKSRPTDLFLASSPKSGTTLLKAMIFATMTCTNYPLDQHPLLTHNPHECIAYMDTSQSQIIEALPSPRVLATHLPYSILRDSITDSDSRIIYVWRDPKDVLVSYHHFAPKVIEGADKVMTFDQLFEFFCQGGNSFGPIWNHVLGYWEESKRRPEKVLFLRYKHMLQEPVKYAKKLADFIGCPYSEAEENQGVVEQIVELCSFQKLKDLEVNKSGRHPTYHGHTAHMVYFRKGEAGDWQNHMTQEMAKMLDSIIEEKFKGSGLRI